MDLVLDISTSMEFWRRVYPLNRAPSDPGDVVLGDCAYSLKDVERLAPQWITRDFLEPLGGKIHVFSQHPKHKRTSSMHTVHVREGELPHGSFYRLSDSVLVASPPFIFLKAANVLDKHSLIALGCEMCGRYSFDKHDPRGFRTREVPLITIEQLERYLNDAKGSRGAYPAKQALQYVFPNSASPMETFDVMAFCLPPRLGGYSLPQPLLNHEVVLTGRAARIAKRRTCYADIYYPNAPLDVEHQGQFDHSEFENWTSDRARVNGLKEMGIEVIELTKDQVGDAIAFECIIVRIANILGKRIRTEHLGETPARKQFRDCVFAWNRSSGSLL